MPTIECLHHEKWERVGLQPSFQPQLWNLKALFASGAMWHSQTWCFSAHPPLLRAPQTPTPAACWTPKSFIKQWIWHILPRLGLKGKWGGVVGGNSGGSAPLSFFSVWLAVGFNGKIVVNLSGTWKVAVLTVPRRCRPNSPFDVLILSQWCRSTLPAVILPAGSTLHLVPKIDW